MKAFKYILAVVLLLFFTHVGVQVVKVGIEWGVDKHTQHLIEIGIVKNGS